MIEPLPRELIIAEQVGFRVIPSGSGYYVSMPSIGDDLVRMLTAYYALAFVDGERDGSPVDFEIEQS